MSDGTFNVEALTELKKEWSKPISPEMYSTKLIVPIEMVDCVTRIFETRQIKRIGNYSLMKFRNEKPVWERKSYSLKKQKPFTREDCVRQIYCDCDYPYCEHSTKYFLPRAMRRQGYSVATLLATQTVVPVR